MSLIFSEWLAILIFIVVSIGLSGVLFGLSYAFISQNPDLEKTSAYECGFNPFEDSRNRFDVRFYVVAILFIIFDLEVIFLCPWSLVLRRIDSLGFWSMMLFLVLVTIGFIFEWRKGALDLSYISASRMPRCGIMAKAKVRSVIHVIYYVPLDSIYSRLSAYKLLN